LVNSLPDSALNKRSANPGWTNGQIIWHIVFAFILTPILIVILRFFGRLPRRWSKLFALALNYSTPVFNLVNAIGPRVAVKIFTRRSIARLFDRIIDRILIMIYNTKDRDWELGMYYPNRWDPTNFKEYMTFNDIVHYPILHLRHHLAEVET